MESVTVQKPARRNQRKMWLKNTSKPYACKGKNTTESSFGLSEYHMWCLIGIAVGDPDGDVHKQKWSNLSVLYRRRYNTLWLQSPYDDFGRVQIKGSGSKTVLYDHVLDF